MMYCNVNHQVAHRSSHKYACNAIARRCASLADEEQKLRNDPGDNFMMPADPFTNAVGHFWGILGTRDYMRSRLALVKALQEVKTYESAQTQLDHSMDMLRLCRSDNMGVRDLVPALMLRLNKDQECYDFVKWWSTTTDDYDWGDTDLPYLDLKKADVFESVEYLCGDWVDLAHLVAITLLKIRLLLDLMALRDATTAVGSKVPAEILHNIQGFVARSSVISDNERLIQNKTDPAVVCSLEAQVEALYRRIQKANEYFWPTLLEPGSHLTAQPESYSRGSVEEMQLVLMHSYDSWIETAGAIDFIKAKRKE
jgi:hypothetical protein